MIDVSIQPVAKEIGRGSRAAVAHRPTQDFALVIGVDHYPNFQPLQGAAADATAFYNWVCAPSGGGVADEHACLLVSTPCPATPIQDQIDDHLLALMQAADALGGGRRFYFYFSGHGATDPGQPAENVALLLARWSRNLARVALSSRDYSDRLTGAGLFEELVVFLDCCRSIGVGAVGLPPQVTFSASVPLPSTSNFIAYATETRNSAFEIYVGDRWEGVFTRRLLTILQQSPTGIAAAALKDRLERVPESGVSQCARVRNELLAGAAFGNGGVLPELHVTFQIDRTRVRLRDGNGQVVAEHDAADGPWRLSLPYGLYKLEDDGGARRTFDHGEEQVTRVEF